MRYFRVFLCGLLAVLAIGPAASAATPSQLMVHKVNQFRRQHGLPALHMSRSLNRTSGRFAHYLMARDVLAHRARPSTSGRFRHAGEVLAMGYGWRLQVANTVRRWSHSAIHRRILLSPSFRYVGAGPSKGRFGRSKAVIWVVQTGA